MELLAEETAISEFKERTATRTDSEMLSRILKIEYIKSISDYYSLMSKFEISKAVDFLSQSSNIWIFTKDSPRTTPFDSFIQPKVKDLLETEPSDKSSDKPLLYFTVISGSDPLSEQQKPGILHLNICLFEFRVQYKYRQGIRYLLNPFPIKTVICSYIGTRIFITPTFLDLHF